MKVSDILRVKGGTLYTISPEDSLQSAVETMAQYDIGSLAVMEHGELVGMLTFREVINRIHANNGAVGDIRVRKVMDDAPLTITPAMSRTTTPPRAPLRRRWPGRGWR